MALFSGLWQTLITLGYDFSAERASLMLLDEWMLEVFTAIFLFALGACIGGF